MHGERFLFLFVLAWILIVVGAFDVRGFWWAATAVGVGMMTSLGAFAYLAECMMVVGWNSPIGDSQAHRRYLLNRGEIIRFV